MGDKPTINWCNYAIRKCPEESTAKTWLKPQQLGKWLPSLNLKQHIIVFMGACNRTWNMFRFVAKGERPGEWQKDGNVQMVRWRYLPQEVGILQVSGCKPAFCVFSVYQNDQFLRLPDKETPKITTTQLYSCPSPGLLHRRQTSVMQRPWFWGSVLKELYRYHGDLAANPAAYPSNQLWLIITKELKKQKNMFA